MTGPPAAATAPPATRCRGHGGLVVLGQHVEWGGGLGVPRGESGGLGGFQGEGWGSGWS